MVEHRLTLDNIQKITKFVHIMSNSDYQADLICGHSVINARSLLGLLSLNFASPLTMRIYSDDASDLLRHLDVVLET